MTSRRLPIILVALLLASAAQAAVDSPASPGSAAGAKTPQGEELARRMQEEIQALGLDASQQAALRQLADDYRTRAARLRERAEAVRDRMLAVQPDEARYGDVTEQASVVAGEVAADGARLAADFRADVFAILTPAQRQKLRDRQAARTQPWDEWRSRHRSTRKPAN